MLSQHAPVVPATLNKVTGRFLAYVRRFDCQSQPDSTTGLYSLKRARRSNNELIGNIVPLDQIRALVDIEPRFESKADPTLTKGSSAAKSSEFWLNKYFHKDLFHALAI